jgi:hypothetical protein
MAVHSCPTIADSAALSTGRHYRGEPRAREFNATPLPSYVIPGLVPGTSRGIVLERVPGTSPGMTEKGTVPLRQHG